MCLSISDIRFTTMPFKPLSDKIFFFVYTDTLIIYTCIYSAETTNEMQELNHADLIVWFLFQRTLSIPILPIKSIFFAISLSYFLSAEPIGPNFFVGPRVTQWKVNGWSNFQKCASYKIRLLKTLKIQNKILQSTKFFFRRWAGSALKA